MTCCPSRMAHLGPHLGSSVCFFMSFTSQVFFSHLLFSNTPNAEVVRWLSLLHSLFPFGAVLLERAAVPMRPRTQTTRTNHLGYDVGASRKIHEGVFARVATTECLEANKSNALTLFHLLCSSSAW